MSAHDIAAAVECLICIVLAATVLYAQIHARPIIETSWNELLAQLAPVRLTVQSLSALQSKSYSNKAKLNPRLLENLVRMRLNAEVLSVLIEEANDLIPQSGHNDLRRVKLQYLQFRCAAQLTRLMTVCCPPSVAVDGSVMFATLTYWRMVRGLVTLHKRCNPTGFEALAVACCCDEI